MKKIFSVAAFIICFILTFSNAYAAGFDYGKYKSKADIYIEKDDNKSCVLVIYDRGVDSYETKLVSVADKKTCLSLTMKQNHIYNFFLLDSMERLVPKCRPLRLTTRSEDKTHAIGQDDGYTPLY